MKIRTPEYYKDFSCIGGDCIDTCCAGWEVDVDKKSSAYYRSVSGPFGDRLRSMLVDKPIEDQFILQENARCPFLNKDNLCDIYTELGEDKLCETCTNFPRHITEFGDTREIGISLSCPVAVELIMKSDKPIEFVVEQTEERLTTYNDIDAELYFTLLEARRICYKLCQNRALSVNVRAALTLDFARKLQKNIGKTKKLRKIIEKYSDTEFITKRMVKLDNKAKAANTNAFLDWLRVYEGLEHIKTEWMPIVKSTKDYINSDFNAQNSFDELMRSKEYEYEHLLVYYIYRYFLRAVFDEEVYEKAALGCVALIMQQLCGGALYKDKGEFGFSEQITLMRIYSKETEHSEENLEELFKHINEDKAFSFKNILSLLYRK